MVERRPPGARTGAAAPRSPTRVQLYRMSAHDALRALPAGAISMLVTDPPYTTVDRRSGSGHLRCWFKASLTWAEIGRVLKLARQKLRPDGVAFVMTNGDGLGEALAAMERAGFARVRTITWDKRVPGLGGGLRHRTEYVLVGYLPGSRALTGSDLVSVQAVGPGTASRYPTEKPEGLGRTLSAIASVGRATSCSIPSAGVGRSSSVRRNGVRPSSPATSRLRRSGGRRPSSASARLRPARLVRPRRPRSRLRPRRRLGGHRAVPRDSRRAGG